MWVDSFWAVLLLGISVLGGSVTEEARGAELPAVTFPIMILLSLVVALRRRMPEKMLILALLLGLVQLIADTGTLPANFAFLVIIYTVAADGARWASRIALTSGLCAAPVAQMRW